MRRLKTGKHETLIKNIDETQIHLSGDVLLLIVTLFGGRQPEKETDVGHLVIAT